MGKYNDCYDHEEEKRKRKLKMLGDLTRGAYLGENPHGYRKSKSIHRSKKKYNRKRKDRNQSYY